MRDTPIDLIVNGAPRSTDAVTLADLLAGEDYGEARIATAVNGNFVPAAARHETRLNPGDRIEIVSARQGG